MTDRILPPISADQKKIVRKEILRFNHRLENDLGRFVLVLKDVIGKRLTYAELISADMQPART